MKRKLFGWPMVLLLCLCARAQATLVEWDAFATGDHLAVKDNNSGLVWLDLSLTAGMSYQDASTRFDGWEVASADQVGELFSHAFSDFTDNSGNGAFIGCAVGNSCYSQAQHYTNVFGYTPHRLAPSFHYSFGLFENAQKSLQMMGTVVQTGLNNANIYSQLYDVNYSGYKQSSLYNLSVYLVKSAGASQTKSVAVNPSSISEPGAILAIVLPALLLTCRKRQQIRR